MKKLIVAFIALGLFSVFMLKLPPLDKKLDGPDF